jgi:hypothetical protein
MTEVAHRCDVLVIQVLTCYFHQPDRHRHRNGGGDDANFTVSGGQTLDSLAYSSHGFASRITVKLKTVDLADD